MNDTKTNERKDETMKTTQPTRFWIKLNWGSLKGQATAINKLGPYITRKAAESAARNWIAIYGQSGASARITLKGRNDENTVGQLPAHVE